MKYRFVLIIMLLVFSIFKNYAQKDSLINVQKLNKLKVEIENIKSENDKLSHNYKNLYNKYNSINTRFINYQKEINLKLDNLKEETSSNKTLFESTTTELNVKLKNSEKNTNSLFETLNKRFSKNTLYWILAVGLVIISLIITAILLRKLILSNKKSLIQDIEKTRINIENESVKLDNKLLELLEKQLSVKDTDTTKKDSNNEEVDHSLAIKVADEIVRIQKNLSQMDESIKGKKQLNASIERIRSNFEANGYEIVDMLNKPYNDGMKVQANFIPVDNLKQDEQIISRIIKPQINYNGVMIQSAQVEVKQGV